MTKQPDEEWEDHADSPGPRWIIATILGGAMAACVIFLATYNWVTLEIFP